MGRTKKQVATHVTKRNLCMLSKISSSSRVTAAVAAASPIRAVRREPTDLVRYAHAIVSLALDLAESGETISERLAGAARHHELAGSAGPSSVPPRPSEPLPGCSCHRCRARQPDPAAAESPDVTPDDAPDRKAA